MAEMSVLNIEKQDQGPTSEMSVRKCKNYRRIMKNTTTTMAGFSYVRPMRTTAAETLRTTNRRDFQTTLGKMKNILPSFMEMGKTLNKQY